MGPLPLPRNDEQGASRAQKPYTHPAGLVPRGGSGLGFLHHIWARCRSFSQQRIIAQPALHPSCFKSNNRSRPLNDNYSVHRTKGVAVGHTTGRFDSRPRLMTLSSYTKPRAKAGIARVLDTVHIGQVAPWQNNVLHQLLYRIPRKTLGACLRSAPTLTGDRVAQIGNRNRIC